MKSSKKVKFYEKVVELLNKYEDNILENKERIPWSSSKVGATYAVTTYAVSYELGQLQHSLRDLIREEKI